MKRALEEGSRAPQEHQEDGEKLHKRPKAPGRPLAAGAGLGRRERDTLPLEGE